MVIIVKFTVTNLEDNHTLVEDIHTLLEDILKEDIVEEAGNYCSLVEEDIVEEAVRSRNRR